MIEFFRKLLKKIKKKPKVLVIILAETRAHELTFKRFQKNVLEVLDADLAVCVGQKQAKVNDPFHKAAKYHWIINEPDDFGDAYDFACKNSKVQKNDWRSAVTVIKDQLFGGVKVSQHLGSAGILIFFRWFLMYKLQTTGVLQDYDFFIVTRSDYFYEHKHPVVTFEQNANKIWIPKGEDYGGITDRHIVVPRNLMYDAMSLMDILLHNPRKMIDEMKHHKLWNLEQYIHHHFKKKNLLDKIVRFPSMMYAVRLPHGTTRWAMGSYNKDVNMIVKYETEYRDVLNYKI